MSPHFIGSGACDAQAWARCSAKCNLHLIMAEAPRDPEFADICLVKDLIVPPATSQSVASPTRKLARAKSLKTVGRGVPATVLREFRDCGGPVQAGAVGRFFGPSEPARSGAVRACACVLVSGAYWTRNALSHPGSGREANSCTGHDPRASVGSRCGGSRTRGASGIGAPMTGPGRPRDRLHRNRWEPPFRRIVSGTSFVPQCKAGHKVADTGSSNAVCGNATPGREFGEVPRRRVAAPPGGSFGVERSLSKA